MILAGRTRLHAALLAAFCATVAWAVGTQPISRAAPVYQTLHGIADWWVWAALWASVAAVLLVAAVTRSVVVWRIGTVLAAVVACTWVGGLMWEHYVGGATISTTGIALWSWLITSIVLIGTSPY